MQISRLLAQLNPFRSPTPKAPQTPAQDPQDLVAQARHAPDRLPSLQQSVHQLKIAHDPELQPQDSFSKEDVDFLVRGEGDPAQFLESRFPALKTAFSVNLRGREDVSGGRLLNRRNQLSQAFEFFEPALRRTDLPDVPGVRVKPLLRMVASLYYLDRLTDNPQALHALKRDGFRLGDRKKHNEQVFDHITARLNFTKKERAFGKQLLNEVPYTGNRPTVGDYLIAGGPKHMDYMDAHYTKSLAEESAAMGLPPATLFQLGTLLHVAHRGLLPIELRHMNWTPEGWQGNPLGPNFKGTAAVLQQSPIPTVGVLTAVARAANELDQIQDEMRIETLQAKPVRHPLFHDGQLRPEGIVLSHASQGLPTGGKLRPNSAFSEGPPLLRDPRELVEFSWNGVIDQWCDAPVAVLTPLTQVPEDSLQNLWYTATSTLGEFDIPQGSRILVREDIKIPANERELWQEKGLEVTRFAKDQPTTEAAESALEEMGYQPMMLGTDLSGGLGTDTTWLDTTSMTDFFRDENVARSTELSESLARTQGVSNAAATDEYPLGHMTLRLEGFHDDFQRKGWVLPSSRELPEVREMTKEFTEIVQQVQSSDADLPRALESAVAFSDAMQCDLELHEKHGREFFRGLSRELSSGQSGPHGKEMVRHLNQRYGTDFGAWNLTSVEDLINLRVRASSLRHQS